MYYGKINDIVLLKKNKLLSAIPWKENRGISSQYFSGDSTPISFKHLEYNGILFYLPCSEMDLELCFKCSQGYFESIAYAVFHENPNIESVFSTLSSFNGSGLNLVFLFSDFDKQHFLNLYQNTYLNDKTKTELLAICSSIVLVKEISHDNLHCYFKSFFNMYIDNFPDVNNLLRFIYINKNYLLQNNMVDNKLENVFIGSEKLQSFYSLFPEISFTGSLYI